MSQSILLSKEFIDAVLNNMRGNLERDGYIHPMLLIYPFALSDVDVTMVPLKLPDDSQKQAQYFKSIGHRLLRTGCIPTEAIFLSESWYVNNQTAPAARRMLPHEHPTRQEAIIIAGRNAYNTRSSSVVQPFTRDKNNRPVWQKLSVAVYDEPSSGSTTVQVLDYFFDALTIKV